MTKSPSPPIITTPAAAHDTDFYRYLATALEAAGWGRHPTLVWGYVHLVTGLLVQPYTPRTCRLLWPVGGACKILIGLDEDAQHAAFSVLAQAVSAVRREVMSRA